MAEVKRPLDKKLEGKVPPIDAKDVPEGEDESTGTEPEDAKEKK